MCRLIMAIFNTKFRCTLIAINFQAINLVSVLYAKYGDYATSDFRTTNESTSI